MSVQTGKQDWDLSDLETAKSYLATFGVTADDDVIQRMLSAMSGAIYDYLNRSVLISASNIVEKADGNGKTRITTDEYPITAVASVVANGESIPASLDGFSQSGFIFNKTSISLIGRVFTFGRSNVTLTYTAGYAKGSRELAALEQAVIEWLGVRYRERSHIGEISKNLQGMVVSYTQKDMPASVQQMLSTYIKYTGF